MKLLLLLFSSLALPFFPGFSQKIRSGKWSGYLVLEKNVQLPFDFVVSKNAITIINDTEEIVLTTKNTSNDSVDFVFPNFDSFLRISTKNKKQSIFVLIDLL